MATFGQLVQFGPFFSSGSLCTLKVYHYTAGTTTLLDVYTDRAKTTTAAQPVESDANGIASFYADGLFKFRIDGSTDGVNFSTLYTYDNWSVADASGAFAGEGAAITSASTLTLGTDGNQFHVSGSTGPITAISGTQPEVTLIFDSTPTLTHSGNLILANSVDVVVFAGLVMKFMFEGSGVWRETGRAWGNISDSRTNTVAQAFIVRAATTGTPAASIGTGILFQAESQDEAPSDFGQIEAVASDISTGTEDTYFQLLLRVAGAALTSCYRFAATGAFNAIFTHANSAARTYTLQNFTGTIPLKAGTAGVMNPINDDSTTTTAHGLGATPSYLVAQLECLSDDAGYTTGMIIFLPSVEPSVDKGFSFYANSTNTVITCGVDVGVLNPGTFNNSNIDETKWKVTIIPYV